jgi:6-pyruvoyl-tetrahydropterin synthase
MKIISYSLWGDNPDYTIGAIRNAEQAEKIYPDWICRFYCFSTVPKIIKTILKSKKNTQIIECQGESNNIGMFKRFEPLEENIERVIFRDTDSRLSKREKAAVDEWINAKTDVHIMRDHEYHTVPILGGMWGIVGNKIKGLNEAISKFNPTTNKGQDQEFLAKWLYSKILNKELTTTVHDPFFENKQFPLQIRGGNNNNVLFIGQFFDEFENSPLTERDLKLFKEVK